MKKLITVFLCLCLTLLCAMTALAANENVILKNFETTAEDVETYMNFNTGLLTYDPPFPTPSYEVVDGVKGKAVKTIIQKAAATPIANFYLDMDTAGQTRRYFSVWMDYQSASDGLFTVYLGGNGMKCYIRPQAFTLYREDGAKVENLAYGDAGAAQWGTKDEPEQTTCGVMIPAGFKGYVCAEYKMDNLVNVANWAPMLDSLETATQVELDLRSNEDIAWTLDEMILSDELPIEPAQSTADPSVFAFAAVSLLGGAALIVRKKR
ncbi:MAG: hypothetical protein KH354_02080 [Clostridiales bacterium]|nr:hypothetical protein [Clostridiales bacterium]